MIIKLIRIDSLEPVKIFLPKGKHVIGRGKLLECDNKRISRQHGELIVNDDSIMIKALHQNPCFYILKGTTETQILRLHSNITLCNGDRFGLLPDSCWYEVLLCQDGSESNEPDRHTEEYAAEQNSNQNITLISTQVNNDDSQSLIKSNCNENFNASARAESPSLISTESNEFQQIDQNESIPTPNQNEPESHNPDNNEPVTNEPLEQNDPPVPNMPNEPVTEEPNVSNPVKNEPLDQTNNEASSSSDASPSIKRSHSPEACGTKKIKTENDEENLKQNEPGPSDQASAANVPPVNIGAGNNPNRPRERCMYGANCYRRNPQHKAQFSHPTDSDWGAARRWRGRAHPPGASAPPPPGMQVVERRGNLIYVNAHTVNFYDDHFEVQDEDGDSVDYDYEF